MSSQRQIRRTGSAAVLAGAIFVLADLIDLVADSDDFGANSFVRKAVDFAEFLVTARQLGVYWLVVNTSPRPAGTTQ